MMLTQEKKIEKNVGAVWNLPAKWHSQSGPIIPKLGLIGSVKGSFFSERTDAFIIPSNM